MVEVPAINYSMKVTSTLGNPKSKYYPKGPPTRVSEVLNWETSRLIELFLKDNRNIRPTEKEQLSSSVVRVQDKDARWVLIRYSASGRWSKKVKLEICDPDSETEFKNRQEAADLLAGKLTKLLYAIDPVGLAEMGAPKN